MNKDFYEELEKQRKEREAKMFKNIIGYDNIKNTLKMVIDVLNGKNRYEELGVSIPNGLLLYGPPGTGKTTMAKEIIKNVNRTKFTIRKNKSNGDFIGYINKIFDEAIYNQPSIIFLDDIDKFEDDEVSTNALSTVQSLMGNIKEGNIFIIATANDIRDLPKSLLRSGRFDIQIEVNNPEEDDAIKLFEYYLNNKKIADDVNIKNIYYILDNASCADLEKVCNQAGIYAGYKNKSLIGMEDLIKASLEHTYKTLIYDDAKKDKYSLNIAYHEAGHALIGELLEKGSVAFITTAISDGNIKGYTNYHNNDNYCDDMKFMENRVKSLLGGKAATEVVFQKNDVGCNSDLHRVYDITRRFVDNYCAYGFDTWFYNLNETSEKVKEKKDSKTNEIIDNYYKEVKELLIKNRPILDELAQTLDKKKILFHDEIEAIFKKHKRGKRWAI